MHQPVSRGLAVFADAWLSDWLAEISADLREMVAHQRWCHDDALYKSTTLLYFFTFIQNISASFSAVVKVGLKRWGNSTFPLPPLPCPPFPSPSLRSRLPLIQLGGLGERCKLPQRVRAEPGRQTHLGAF